MGDASPSTKELVAAALRELERTPLGSPSGPAVRALVVSLAPVVHARVARTLLYGGRNTTHSRLREGVEDVVQHVWAKLFEDRARVLRAWRPELGLSLVNWVGRFAMLRALDAVRTDARIPWRDGGEPPQWLVDRDTPEDHAAVAELWRRARKRVLGTTSELGREMFVLLFEEDLSAQEVEERTGTSVAAVLQWRSRLRSALVAAFRESTTLDHAADDRR